MKKRFMCLFTVALFVCTMILPANAVQQMYCETYVIHTEYGAVEVDRTVTVYDSLARSNTRRANVTDTYKYSGQIIAEVTLSATFGYDGKTSRATSASASHTTYDGWSYGNETITKSGGTATLTATLSHSKYRSIAVNISMTCSPTGQIS